MKIDVGMGDSMRTEHYLVHVLGITPKSRAKVCPQQRILQAPVAWGRERERERELIFLLSFTYNYVLSVWRDFPASWCMG